MTRVAVALLCLALLAVPLAAEAQPAGRVFRLGYIGLSPPTAQTQPVWQAFQDALQQHGWIEGRNLVFERRYTEGKVDRVPAVAAEPIALRVDVIVVAGGDAVTQAIHGATRTVPIVMATGGDPVGIGVAASLAPPGGNIAGIIFLAAAEVFAKYLELLKEAVPHVRGVRILWDSSRMAHRGWTQLRRYSGPPGSS